jgi:hypothetical protein
VGNRQATFQRAWFIESVLYSDIVWELSKAHLVGQTLEVHAVTESTSTRCATRLKAASAAELTREGPFAGQGHHQPFETNLTHKNVLITQEACEMFLS